MRGIAPERGRKSKNAVYPFITETAKIPVTGLATGITGTEVRRAL
jgi:hypothetical protein